jgi:hypothetical protein
VNQKKPRRSARPEKKIIYKNMIDYALEIVILFPAPGQAETTVAPQLGDF